MATVDCRRRIYAGAWGDIIETRYLTVIMGNNSVSTITRFIRKWLDYTAEQEGRSLGGLAFGDTFK